jgi:hypothetical protein
MSHVLAIKRVYKQCHKGFLTFSTRNIIHFWSQQSDKRNSKAEYWLYLLTNSQAAKIGMIYILYMSTYQIHRHEFVKKQEIQQW